MTGLDEAELALEPPLQRAIQHDERLRLASVHVARGHASCYWSDGQPVTTLSLTHAADGGLDTTGTSTTSATSAKDQLVERLFGATIAALDLLHVWVGERLGLYRTLAEAGPATAAELGARAGIAERYAREWLEHQAVAGLLTVTDTADPASRTFTLPPGHDEVLLDRDSLSYMTPLALGVVGMAQALPRVREAFKTGLRGPI